MTLCIVNNCKYRVRAYKMCLIHNKHFQAHKDDSIEEHSYFMHVGRYKVLKQKEFDAICNTVGCDKHITNLTHGLCHNCYRYLKYNNPDWRR